MENEDWFVDCKDTHSYRIGTQEETKETIKLRIDLVKHKRLEHKEKEKIKKNEEKKNKNKNKNKIKNKAKNKTKTKAKQERSKQVEQKTPNKINKKEN